MVYRCEGAQYDAVGAGPRTTTEVLGDQHHMHADLLDVLHLNKVGASKSEEASCDQVPDPRWLDSLQT